MSRSTPRKARHRHHASNSGPRQVVASDYESDAAQYMENRESLPSSNPQPARDNTELSLRVLRRYQPSIRSILSIAANAVAYNFLESTQGWEKHGAEGTMFVCEQEPFVSHTGEVVPRVCVFVLNRRSMENLEIDLLRVTDCEVVGELIVFRLEDDATGTNIQGEEGAAAKKILGLWIHADETNTREVHASLILGAWQQGRQALGSYLQATTATAPGNGAFAPDVQASMAPGGSSVAGKRNRDNMPTPTDGDDAIASAVKRQLTLVSSFQGWLARNIGADGDRNDIIARVQKRLDSYRQWLDAGHALERPSEDSEPWTMSVQVTSGSDDSEHVIVVTGPGSGDPIRIIAKDDSELKYLISDSYLGHMTKICHAFAKAQDTLRTLLRTVRELDEETSHLSQPAEITVRTYIRSLQEYNDIKDIGQQLVGLIAENRGVPVRSLYEAGEFGLSFPQ
ncbi:hypothetical protein MYCTH_2138386 [Thermothelomyces thermophilus ATCC 42464]|uniref:Uncharacterized protein n=1 Tax=Thermothelomyces thermophilus (strain ATCC 42464 / BCRC 31852 / DSM 1799) TaxID=573729 RepID=G2QA94_THET4|nr:uncharacterized protein MYCTH_2138386 [Thermothelomyces thermophilus ATCC 42464]AEO56644.1 hypothetical protein MYCTH_2138386 [Thermothelomyces thermophilus ATCC 42464]